MSQARHSVLREVGARGASLSGALAGRLRAIRFAAVVVVTIDEGEGRDRSSLDLPGNQVETIRAVAATGTSTIVILIAGAPVTMGDWLGDAAT